MRMNRICTGQKYYYVQKNMYRKEVHRDNVQKRWNTEYKILFSTSDGNRLGNIPKLAAEGGGGISLYFLPGN